MLHSPAYASTIQSELEREHNRQAELLKHTKFLEQSIAKLHSDGTDLLNRFTKRVSLFMHSNDKILAFNLNGDSLIFTFI